MNERKQGARDYSFPESGFCGKCRVKGIKYVFDDESEILLIDTNGERYFLAPPASQAAKFMNRVCRGAELTADEKALEKDLNDALDKVPAQIVDCEGRENRLICPRQSCKQRRAAEIEKGTGTNDRTGYSMRGGFTW